MFSTPHVSEPHFHLLGFPVRIEWQFWLFTGFLGLRLAESNLWYLPLWLVISLVSILIHEMGHALAFRAYDIGSWIQLWGLGGLCHGERSAPDSGRRIFVSLAGPAAGLAVGLPVYIYRESVAIQGEYLWVFCWLWVFANVFWSLVNLLPMPPLDGGSVSLELFTTADPIDGRRKAHLLGIATAVGFAVWMLTSYGSVFGAVMGLWLAYYNFKAMQGATPAFGYSPPMQGGRPMKKAKRSRTKRGKHADNVVEVGQTSPRAIIAGGTAALTRGDISAALAAAEHVLDQNRSGQIGADAAELLAWAHLLDHDLTAAQRALDAMPSTKKASRYLRACAEAAASPSEANRSDLVDAFSFGDRTPERSHAVRFLVAWSMVVPATQTMLDRGGSEGTNDAIQLEEALQGLGYDDEAGQVRALLFDD